MNCISLINGKFKDQISVHDRGLFYGDGFFETMLWKKLGKEEENENIIEYWKQHFERLKKGCDLMKINIPQEKEFIGDIKKILKKSIHHGLKSGLIKLIISRGVGGRGYKFEKNMKPTIIFLSYPQPSYKKELYRTGVNLKICQTKLFYHDRLFGLKHLNRLDSVLARSEWNNNFFEGVFIDNNENIVEGTMTNLFFVKKNTLYTPEIKGSGINGIMRQIILDNAKVFFEDINEKKIHLSNLNNFDQMFITNSVIKVMPVKKLEKKNFSIKENLKKLIENFN
tara:strand:+ start:792 stop:1637 length:846 start_codon:yes stop_codon:yes gene_type:complete